MHELRIAQDLATIVRAAAADGKLSKVTKVNLCFGSMVQIVPDIFEFAFREVVRDTLAGDAEIKIEILEIRMRCDECGKEFMVMNNRFSCPACKSADLSIIQGNELYIKSIEGE